MACGARRASARAGRQPQRGGVASAPHATRAHPPSHETPSHETPGHETPGHETPGHETPGHETPGHRSPGRRSRRRRGPGKRLPTGVHNPVDICGDPPVRVHTPVDGEPGPHRRAHPRVDPADGRPHGVPRATRDVTCGAVPSSTASTAPMTRTSLPGEEEIRAQLVEGLSGDERLEAGDAGGGRARERRAVAGATREGTVERALAASRVCRRVGDRARASAGPHQRTHPCSEQRGGAGRGRSP